MQTQNIKHKPNSYIDLQQLSIFFRNYQAYGLSNQALIQVEAIIIYIIKPMSKKSSIRRWTSSFAAIFFSNILLNFRRYLLHRQIVIILIFLAIQFVNLHIYISLKVKQNLLVDNTLAFYNIILLIFISRSTVIDYTEHKNHFFYNQKAYGVNVYIYLAAWFMYSIITGLIKVAVYVGLTICFLKYEYLIYPEQFSNIELGILAIMVAYFSFYSYTLFFYTIMPYKFPLVNIITAILMIGIISSQNFGEIRSAFEIKQAIQINPSEWIASIIYYGSTNSNYNYSYDFYRNVALCQSIIPFVASIIIQIIKIKRFQLKNWLINLFKTNKQVLNQDLLNDQFTYQNNSSIKNLISTQKICQIMGKQRILDNITFQIHTGQTILLFGGNGSGKSTLLKIIGSISTLTSGKLNKKKNILVGACLQNNYLYEEFTVKQNIRFYGQIKGLRNLSKKINYLLESFELNQFADKKIYKLSGGNRKKLSLSIAFLGKNDLIVIQQPTIGVDVIIKKQIWRILFQQKAKRKNLSLIIASSDPQIQLVNMVDKFIVMKNGSIITDCTSSQIYQQNNFLTVEFKDINLIDETIMNAIVQIQDKKIAIFSESKINGSCKFELSFKNWSQFELFLNKFSLIQKIVCAKVSNNKDKLCKLINNPLENDERQANIITYLQKVEQISINKSYLRMAWGCILIRISQIFPSYLEAISMIAILPIFWLFIEITYGNRNYFWTYQVYRSYPAYWFYLFPHVYKTEVQAKQSKFTQMMLVHGLKRTLYWIFSIIIDVIIVYMGFALLWILTFVFQTNDVLKSDNSILVSMLLYIIASVTLVKLYTLLFSRSFLCFTSLPFIFTIVQSIIITQVVIDFRFLSLKQMVQIGDIFLPILAYLNIIFLKLQQYIYYNWQIYLYFLAQTFVFFFLIQATTKINFFYRNKQKRINLENVKMVNCSDKINEKLRVIDKSEQDNEKESLTIQNLYIQYQSKHTIIKQMYLGLEKGTIFGLLGKNGSGKSTTLRLITSLITRTSGNIYFNNQQIRSQSSPIYEQMGYCPQFEYFSPNMTVSRHLKIILILKSIPLDKHEEFIKAILAVFEMKNTINREIRHLSEGQKAKLKIATALFCKPKLRYLLLDQPSICLDEWSQQILGNLLLRITKEWRSTVMYITHKISEVESYCNRIGILQRGQFVVISTPKQLVSLYNRGYTITIEALDLKQVKESLYPKLQAIFQVFEWSEDGEKNTIKVSIPNLFFNMKKIIEMLSELKAKKCCNYFCLKKDDFEEVFDYLASRNAEDIISRPRQTELTELIKAN